MTKKKSKNKNKGQQQHYLSPERYMREKARTLPMGKCYFISPDWQKSGITNVVVTRVRPSGNLVMAIFLVDTFCLGVRDAVYNDNMTPDDFEEYLKDCGRRTKIGEVSYKEAHNLIYGAIAFAEEGGIKPVKEFDTAGYVLEEDTEEIPLIEYEFGKDGKHFLVVNPDRKEMPYWHILKKNLGDDFDYILPYAFEDDEYDFIDDEDDYEEEYTYQYPDYPQTLSVRNQFIADELLSPANYSRLPREVIERVLALPKDEAAQDINNVVLFTIGNTYKGINDDTIGNGNNSAIMHSLMLLAQIQSDKGLDAVLEIMRQTGDFAEYHLGDLAPELIHPALYACGKDNVPAIEEYMVQSGLDSYLRSQAPEALAMIVFKHPERRAEIIEVFRRFLNNLVSNPSGGKAYNREFAGFMMSCLMDIGAKELIPEIKAAFAAGCVNKGIAGDCKDVIYDIELGGGAVDEDKYEIPDIYDQYERYQEFITEPE